MRRLFHITTLFILLFAGCGKKEKMVLDTEEMASLMADIHIAEAVVDLNHDEYQTDSARLVLRRSIYDAHGVTPRQVDSSFVWYGYHIEDYMKVYERTIEILNDRQHTLLSESSRQVAIAGDSVDIWPMSRHFEFSRRSPSRILTFSIPSDSNWRNNDVFTLRLNMVTATNPVIARMVVEYADGTSYYNLAAGKNKGTAEVSIRVDSTLSPIRIAGYIITRPDDRETVRLDSISLVRLRKHLSKKYFSQRPFNYGITPQSKISVPDTVATSADTTHLPHTPATSPETENTTARHSLHGHIKGHKPAERPVGTPQTAAPHKTTDNKTSPGQTSRPPHTNPNASKSSQVAPNAPQRSEAQEALRKRDELLRAAQNHQQKRK